MKFKIDNDEFELVVAHHRDIVSEPPAGFEVIAPIDGDNSNVQPAHIVDVFNDAPGFICDGYTSASLVKNDCLIGRADSICSRPDQFVKRLGVKQAVTRCLELAAMNDESINRDVRSKIWAKVWGR